MPKNSKRGYKCLLNCLFIGAFALIELFVIVVFVHLFIRTLTGKENLYTSLSLGLILLWFGIIVGYLAWAVYFYNINMGLTNEDWDNIVKDKENRLLNRSRESTICEEPSKNPYMDQTFGLPPGTVRGVIALTLLFCAVGMLIFSMGSHGNIESQFVQDNFEFFKTAFLMMVAFYFGSRSLEYISRRWRSPSHIIPGPRYDATDGADIITVSTDRNKEGSIVVPENGTSVASPTAIKTYLNNTADKVVVKSTSMIDQKLNDDFPQLKTDAQVSKFIDDADINEIAANYQLEPAAIKAVIKVETNGHGFLVDGRPKILFEGHIFWNQLKKFDIKPEDLAARFPDIVYPHWTRQFYKGGTGEYERLEKAMLIHEEAALCAASWGLFQVMGFNYAPAGFDDVRSFVEAHKESEKEHLKSFMNFINYKSTNQAQTTIEFLRAKDWKGFANRYNGPRYYENQYDRKMEIAYNRFSTINV